MRPFRGFASTRWMRLPYPSNASRREYCGVENLRRLGDRGGHRIRDLTNALLCLYRYQCYNVFSCASRVRRQTRRPRSGSHIRRPLCHVSQPRVSCPHTGPTEQAIGRRDREGLVARHDAGTCQWSDRPERLALARWFAAKGDGPKGRGPGVKQCAGNRGPPAATSAAWPGWSVDNHFARYVADGSMTTSRAAALELAWGPSVSGVFRLFRFE